LICIASLLIANALVVSADRSFYTYYFCTNLYFSTNDSKHKEQEHTQIENLTNTKEYHASSNDTL